MKFASLPLALALPVLALSQTATPAKKPVTHRTSATTSTALPANIPKVPGIAKPLYTLKYIDIAPGTGALAAPTILGASQADSKVMSYTVKYTGWLAKDGTKFDSSYDHPGAEPITFFQGVRRVIPGWDTGFTGMHIGGKRRLFIPYQLAYGDAGKPPIPAKADLIFDVELVSISDQQPAPKARPAPPASPAPATPPPSDAPANQANPAPPPPASSKPATVPDPTKPITDPATNDPAKATTPDNATKPAPKPSTNPPGK